MNDVSLVHAKCQGGDSVSGSKGRILKFCSYLLVLSVAFLIFLGGNVKSHEAGLAVPDWPTSFGYNMFTFPVEFWVGGIFHEHFHRLVASAVGVLTIVHVLLSWFYEPRKTVRILSYLALVMVCIQGVLGGLTVILGLYAATSVLHGVLAQLFFCLTITIAFYHSNFVLRSEVALDKGDGSKLMKLARIYFLFFFLLLIQLVFGAFTRHLEAGLAALDFPTTAGEWLPLFGERSLDYANQLRARAGFGPVNDIQLLLHGAHRFFGYLLGFAALFIVLPRAFKLQRYKFVRSGYRAFLLVIGIQIFLGISVVLTHRLPLVATIHLLCGAVLLGVCWLNFVRSIWVLRLSKE